MDFKEDLKAAGLTKPEVAVYLFLLEQGLAAPPEIAKGASLQRSNTYNVLNALKQKGLIDTQEKGKRRLYSAKDPANIISRLETQKEAMTRLLPDLRALYKSQKNKPTIRFYYELEGIKEMFGRVDGADELRLITSTNTIYNTYPSFFRKFRKGLVKNDVFVRNILTQRSGTRIAEETRAVMRGYYDVRFFPQKYKDMPTSIRLWSNYVGLAIFEEPAVGMVITSEALAATFKTMFETMWSAGEKIF